MAPEDRSEWPEAGAPAADLFVASCRAEILALKPGNVHVHGARGGDGHGMTAADFLTSAEVAAPALTAPGLTVGERILAAVRATREAVGCNTNLGIVLLAAPLAHAAERARPGEGLRPSLARVMDGLTVDCAARAYEAIRIAAPAGLGRVERHDVAQRPSITLHDAMGAAAERDRIAAQYATNFADVFGIGVRRIEEIGAASPALAAEAVYWGFLTAFEDSHVARKHGAEVAAWLLDRAREMRGMVEGTGHPPERRRLALGFDQDLKRRGINPGTSADLTVGSLFAALLGRGLASATTSHPKGGTHG